MQNGLALEHAAECCKRDRDIVLAAVRQNGRALAHAAETMKRDHEAASAAVQQNSCALYDVAFELLRPLAMMRADRILDFVILTLPKGCDQNLPNWSQSQIKHHYSIRT
eukprot:3568076-Amphidinium_carterae.1